MQERSLKLYNTDKTFFVKISNKLTQLLMPTKFGINNIMISIKRSNMLKAFNVYKEVLKENNAEKEEIATQKYEETYALYLESIDKYIMESLYKKVKNNMASQFEKDALSSYYTIVNLKDRNYTEYKYRKQKYLLELEYQGISSTHKVALINKINPFYIEKMDSLYKGIIKNYSVQLADNVNKNINKDEIYSKIFNTIEEYVINILPIKMQQEEHKNNKELMKEYDKYQRFLAGKLDDIDILEKNAVLLAISRLVFTHSLPLAIAEKCYIKLLKDARKMIVKYYKTSKYAVIYKLFMEVVEEYNLKLLSTKVYWDKPSQRDEYKKFWNEYKNIQSISDENKLKEQKEILFIKNDLKALNNSKNDYNAIIEIYKKNLVELGAMRQFKNSVKNILTQKYTGKKISKKVVTNI